MFIKFNNELINTRYIVSFSAYSGLRDFEEDDGSLTEVNNLYIWVKGENSWRTEKCATKEIWETRKMTIEFQLTSNQGDH